MVGTRWRLFRLLGVPVGVDASWLVVLALLSWTLADLFTADVPDLSRPAYWAMGLVAALAFFACVVLHELGHAVAARATGTPIRGITLFLFGGIAEMEGEPKSARAEFLVATAGPAVSAVLAAGFWLLSGLPWPGPVTAVLRHLASINLAVMVFNLAPAFPLDGGRVLRSVLWGATGDPRRATRRAAACGRTFAWVLIGLGLLHLFAGQVVQGVWLGLIGMFLNAAARGSYEQVLLRQVLGGERVARFMTAEPVVVPPGLGLRDWVEEYVYRHHRTSFPVGSDGRLEGVIGTPDLARYPREEWAKHTVGEVMRGEDLDEVSIRPDADALEALGKMQRAGSDQLLVTEDGRLVGVIGREDLLGFLSLKLELEDAGR